jgi:hypothetical protein
MGPCHGDFQQATCTASPFRGGALRPELMSVSVWLSVTALATAQSRATPAELVEQLAVAESRANARTQLLAFGKQAVPALANRVTATEPGLQAEALAILIELGPDAGGAVPQLIAAVERNGPVDPTPALQALAELGPFRAADVQIDVNDMARAVFMHALRGARRGGNGVEMWSDRLRRRLDFPRAPDIETLLVIAQGCHAYRVELAVEHLALHGSAAAAALPLLQRLLERPEPRILMTDRTVPIHRKAARAMLAIAPASPQADIARAVLAGMAPPAAAAPPVPERARARVATLVTELDVPAKRAAAAANLVALGTLAASAVAATLAHEHDVDSREAALGVLRDLGPRAAATVPELLEALASLSTEHSVSVLRALQATAPWCTDVIPGLSTSCSIGDLSVFGRRVRGNADGAFLTAFFAASAQLHAAMAVDPSSSLTELDALLGSPNVATREAALAVVRERGAECTALLPTLDSMLTATAPKGNVVQWRDEGVVGHLKVDRSAAVQYLAAQAIVAVALPDDPLVAAARDVLARGEPK